MTLEVNASILSSSTCILGQSASCIKPKIWSQCLIIAQKSLIWQHYNLGAPQINYYFYCSTGCPNKFSMRSFIKKISNLHELEFWIFFVKNIRQIEVRSAMLSYNVNKLSRVFSFYVTFSNFFAKFPSKTCWDNWYEVHAVHENKCMKSLKFKVA